MEKETVLILLLLKPMTKTNKLNDIAIMILATNDRSFPFFGTKQANQHRLPLWG